MKRRLFHLGLGRPRPRDAVDWEIEHHLAELADRLVERGWHPEEAAREAERRFGGVRTYRRRLERIERRRTTMARWTGFTVAAWEVLAGSVRSLARQPGLGAAVVLTLGLGIGANAAMFTILDRLFFQPPTHVEEPDEVRRVMVERSSTVTGETFATASLAHPDLTDLDAHGGIDAWAAYSSSAVTLGRGAGATQVRAVTASHTLFPLLGVSAAEGRFFGPDDDRPGATPVAVVSHEFRERRLGGGTDVLGSTLELGGTDFTVVGVAPRGFTGVDLAPVDVWLPLHTGGVVTRRGEEWRDSRGWFWLRGVVRLADGSTLAAAQDEATALHRAGREESIAEERYDPGARVRLDPLVLARGPEADAESKVAGWLGAMSLLLLLIVCANVANLLLARGTRRHREVAVRLALGISRRRLVAGTIAETMLLGLLGSGVALAVAWWGGEVIRAVLLPRVLFPAAAGARVVLFTAALALVAGGLAGLAPGLQATRLDLARDLTLASRAASGRSRARDLLAVGQAALSVLLLVGAGLFVRSVAQVRSLDLGLDVDRVAMVTLHLDLEAPAAAFDDEEGRRAEALETNALYGDAMRRARGVPGVEAVAATGVPFQWSFAMELAVPGRDSLPTLPGGGPYYYTVTPGYFEAAGLRLLAGRSVRETDDAGAARVAWVSETMAATLWPDEGALGRCLMVGDDEGCTTVVGVVEDASRGSLEEEAHMAYYLPVAQREDQRLGALYARAGGDAVDEVVPALATALRGLDPRVRFAEVETLREILDPQARSWMLGAALFSVFGALALVVAAVGLYGLLAFHVAQRTRELGIRAALGAARARLLRDVLGRGARLTLAGVGLGLALALALGRFAEPLLFRVSPSDPLVLGGVAAMLAAAGLLASLLPGLRATRIDPMDALRAE